MSSHINRNRRWANYARLKGHRGRAWRRRLRANAYRNAFTGRVYRNRPWSYGQLFG